MKLGYVLMVECKYGEKYWETYAPMVNWSSVRLRLSITKIHNFPLKGIDSILVFPRVDVGVPVYLESQLDLFQQMISSKVSMCCVRIHSFMV